MIALVLIGMILFLFGLNSIVDYTWTNDNKDLYMGLIYFFMAGFNIAFFQRLKKY